MKTRAEEQYNEANTDHDLSEARCVKNAIRP